ncbi:MAG: NFACT RNA binding domain-containing protein [Candidatus Norongarragalinales archaeon]
MKITLDVRKSAMQNAQALFEEAKKFRRKAEGARKAIEETKRKIAFAQTKTEETKKQTSGRERKKWFHEYRFFTTTNGFLCVGGKNAKQNDTLVASQLKEGDLFFHADVHGASAVVLKEGTKAKEQDLREAAQFAACYSNAWKLGSGVADVYCVSKEQVSKHSHGEFVGKGAFLISGERKWFKNMRLEIAVGTQGGELIALPALAAAQKKGFVFLVPGGKKKEELFPILKGKLSLRKSDGLFAVLPGNCETA